MSAMPPEPETTKLISPESETKLPPDAVTKISDTIGAVGAVGAVDAVDAVDAVLEAE